MNKLIVLRYVKRAYYISKNTWDIGHSFVFYFLPEVLCTVQALFIHWLLFLFSLEEIYFEVHLIFFFCLLIAEYWMYVFSRLCASTDNFCVSIFAKNVSKIFLFRKISFLKEKEIFCIGSLLNSFIYFWVCVCGGGGIRFTIYFLASFHIIHNFSIGGGKQTTGN